MKRITLLIIAAIMVVNVMAQDERGDLHNHVAQQFQPPHN